MTASVERATTLGRVRGIARLGVETYLGLRYAQPVRRFEPPAPASAWSGTYDATSEKAMAPQPSAQAEVFGYWPKGGYAEDCLFLNLHVPQQPSPVPRPVLVFIHGGSFTIGGANFYDGTSLALGADAVVVCINYRLGLLGALDRTRFDTENEGTGELWLLDQIMALQWVRDNVADFGGNPNLVTVMGESAGAISTCALCAAPSARGLLHRAVAFSPGKLISEPASDVIGNVAKYRGCSRVQALDYLSNLPVEELLAVQKRRRQAVTPSIVCGTPVLPGRIEDLIGSRGADAVPLIAGYAAHEGDCMDYLIKFKTGLPRPLLDLAQHIVARSGAKHSADGKANVSAYLKRLKKVSGSRGFGAAFNDLLCTDVFRRASMYYTEATTVAGSQAYLYVIDLPTRIHKVLLRSTHCVDLALTFDVWGDPEHTVPPLAEHPGAPALAKRWVAMLGHFARTGSPGNALGDWPIYEPTRRASLRVAGDGCRVEHDVDAQYREHVWNSARVGRISEA